MKFNLRKIIEFIFPINELKSIFKIRSLLVISAGFLLLLVVCLVLFIYQLYVPLSKGEAEEVFVVKEGESLREVAENLRIERMIGNKWVFTIYVFLEGKTENLQAGKYNLSSDMNIPKIASKIINGEIIRDWIKVTFPEGWTNKQIEEKLVELEIINLDNPQPFEISTESFSFLIDKPKGPNLQGYLFPDTYYFDRETAIIESVIKKMLTNFDEKLTEDLREEIKRQGKTIYEIVTLASILEKEVKGDEDMAIVSGIFWGRLESNYPLESCATIAYILGVDKWRYSIEDTRIESPFNTYLNAGLPPLPINNPGLSAIKAVIYPQETDYNFFLTDPETGKTIFSKTYQEHLTNKQKYFK